jgi:hypothetical protein
MVVLRQGQRKVSLSKKGLTSEGSIYPPPLHSTPLHSTPLRPLSLDSFSRSAPPRPTTLTKPALPPFKQRRRETVQRADSNPCFCDVQQKAVLLCVYRSNSTALRPRFLIESCAPGSSRCLGVEEEGLLDSVLRDAMCNKRWMDGWIDLF